MSDDTKAIELLIAANHALRSYQYGNASSDLAEEVADLIDAHLNATNGRAVHAQNKSEP